MGYVSFDKHANNQPDIDDDADVTLHGLENTGVRYLPGPVNAALCLFAYDGVEQIIRIRSDCVKDFEGCSNGYHFAYWLYFDEGLVSQEVKVFEFYQFKLYVTFVSDPSVQNVSVRFDMENCQDKTHVLGLRTWNHFVVVFGPARASYDLYVNGIMVDTATCSGMPAVHGHQHVYVGGANVICVDEFVVRQNDANVDPVNLYYFSIVNGE